MSSKNDQLPEILARIEELARTASTLAAQQHERLAETLAAQQRERLDAKNYRRNRGTGAHNSANGGSPASRPKTGKGWRHGRLPEILAEIEELVGRQKALEFAEAFGGTRFYIPRNPEPDGRLARAVGMEAATAIAEYFTTAQTGCEIDVPRGPASVHLKAIFARRKLVADLLGQGRTPTEIALQLAMTRRGVQKLQISIREEQEQTRKRVARSAGLA